MGGSRASGGVAATSGCRRSTGFAPGRSARGRCSRRSLSAELREHDRVDLVDPVDSLLQVRGARPGSERVRKLSRIAKLGETLEQLGAQRVVDVDPLAARRLSEEQRVRGVEAPELADRRLVVVDAEIDERVAETGVAAV